MAQGRCNYYIVEYVPDITKKESTAVGVIITGDSDQSFRGAQFRKDWTPVTSVYPMADVPYFEALGQDVQSVLKARDHVTALARLRDTLSNNVQLRGPVTCNEPASATLLSRLAKIHLG